MIRVKGTTESSITEETVYEEEVYNFNVIRIDGDLELSEELGLNGKVKISIDEFYLILHFLRSKSNIEVDANYFLPLTPLEISDTN